MKITRFVKHTKTCQQCYLHREGEEIEGDYVHFPFNGGATDDNTVIENIKNGIKVGKKVTTVVENCKPFLSWPGCFENWLTTSKT